MAKNWEEAIPEMLIEKFASDPVIARIPNAFLIDDLGFDSLDVIEIVGELELMGGIEISSDTAATFLTIGHLIAFMDRAAPQKPKPPGIKLVQRLKVSHAISLSNTIDGMEMNVNADACVVCAWYQFGEFKQDVQVIFGLKYSDFTPTGKEPQSYWEESYRDHLRASRNFVVAE